MAIWSLKEINHSKKNVIMKSLFIILFFSFINLAPNTLPEGFKTNPLSTIPPTEAVADGIIEAQVRPLAIVRRFKPEVDLLSKDRGAYVLDLRENIGEPLFNGDTLATGQSGYALVIFTSDNSVAKVKPESMLIIRGESLANSRLSNRRIDLEQGEIRLEIEPVGSGSFDVQTSRSLASVKGTVFGNNADGFIWVEEGQVNVTALNSGQTVSLFEQMYAEVDEGGSSVESGTLSDDQLQNLGEGYEDLEEDLIERTVIVRFRDANGQVREIPLTIFEKSDQ